MTKISVMLFTVLLAAPLLAQQPKALDLQVAPRKGAICATYPTGGFTCFGILLNDGTVVDLTISSIIISLPTANHEVMFAKITEEKFTERGNEGTLQVNFRNEYLTGTASFTLYSFRGVPRIPHETTKVMLTSGDVHLVFREEEK